MQKLQENLETLTMITSAKTSEEANGWLILNKTYNSVERAKKVPRENTLKNQTRSIEIISDYFTKVISLVHEKKGRKKQWCLNLIEPLCSCTLKKFINCIINFFFNSHDFI
jgi:hypothetical protein